MTLILVDIHTFELYIASRDTRGSDKPYELHGRELTTLVDL